MSPSEGNVRRAVVGLRLDGEGRLTGTGTLVLNGHHAWRRLRWQDDAEQTTDAWRDWLANAYEVSDVEVDESLDDQQVRVAWSLAQRQEEVLGDETSVVPSLPLGPVKQPFALPPERRLTPVQLPFGDRDEVEMTLTWPAGWEIDVLPEAAGFQSHAGALASQIEVDGSSRRLTYRRRFDVSETEFIGPQGYAVIRDLYHEVEKCDAQNLVLVRR